MSLETPYLTGVADAMLHREVIEVVGRDERIDVEDAPEGPTSPGVLAPVPLILHAGDATGTVDAGMAGMRAAVATVRNLCDTGIIVDPQLDVFGQRRVKDFDEVVSWHGFLPFAIRCQEADSTST